MKLYEINTQLIQLLDQLEPDPETGEIPMPEEEEKIIARINTLALQRDDILQYLAKLVLNCRAEATALKAEESRLKNRRETLERREERLLRILDRECDGVTTDLGVATMSYRRTSHVEVTNETKAVSWLKRHKFTAAFRTPAPTVQKAEVRKLILAGHKVPGCQVVDDRTCSLK